MRSFTTQIYEFRQGKYLFRFVPVFNELQIFRTTWFGLRPVVYIDAEAIAKMLTRPSPESEELSE